MVFCAWGITCHLQRVVMRFLTLLLLPLLLVACAHGAENTGVENAQVIILKDIYAMELKDNTEVKVAALSDEATEEGYISRAEPRMIVTGGPEGAGTPAAGSFYEVMDRLEGLMADKIAANNNKAAKLEKYLSDLGLPPSY